MSKTLTVSEQTALLRYASALPVESDMRKVIVAAVRTAGMDDTWLHRINEAKDLYMEYVVLYAAKIIKGEGYTVTSASSKGRGEVRGTSADGQHKVLLTLDWVSTETMKSVLTVGQDVRRGMHSVLSMSPMNVASESIYKHFQGLLP
jgi:hypothetical protein